MRILGLDTTGERCSVAIMADGKIIVNFSLRDKNTHSVNLMPMVDRALKKAEMSIGDIEAFAVNVGPGSFTGIRIGVCTVMGLAQERHLPSYAVNTLESLAYNALPFVGTICAMIDARRTESYYAIFTLDGASITRTAEDGAKKVIDIIAELPEGPVCFAGDGAVQYRDILENALSGRAVFLSEEAMYPSAVSVLKASAGKAAKGETTAVYDLAPYYLRPSQAERMKTNR